MIGDIKINDLTPEAQLKEIYDEMKGFRVNNAHRKKCTKKAIGQVIEQLYQAHMRFCPMSNHYKWTISIECVYWCQVLRLAEEL